MRVIALAAVVLLLAGSPAWAGPAPQVDPCESPAPPMVCLHDAAPALPGGAPLPEATPSPTPGPTADAGGGEGVLRSAFEAALGAFWDRVRAAAAQTLAARVRTVMAGAAQLLRTPELGGQDRLRQLSAISWALADGVLLLLIAIGLVMRPAGALLSRELLVRVPGAALAVNLVPLVAGKGIEVSNTLVAGFLSAQPDFLSAGTERALVSIGGSVALSWALWLLALLLVALGIMRVALVVILLVAAPLMQLGWVLPATEGAARAWWRLMVGMLLTPVAQALVISAGSWVWGSGGLATAGISGTLTDLLVMVVLTVLLVAVPWIAFRAALAPLFTGVGRLVRAGRTGARLAGVTP